jgi:hypothetical protein
MAQALEDIENLVFFEAYGAAMLAYRDPAHAEETGLREAAAFRSWASREITTSRATQRDQRRVDWRRVTMHALSSIIVTPPGD